jgi:hypothetical protein
VSYLTRCLLILQLFKNSINTQEKLRLNLHSLSVSVSELLEYGRKKQCQQSTSIQYLYNINISICQEANGVFKESMQTTWTNFRLQKTDLLPGQSFDGPANILPKIIHTCS